MPEIFSGKVQIQNSLGETAIDLNPGKRYVRLFDGSGNESIYLNGAGHLVRIFDMSGEDVLTLDTKAAGGGYAGLFLGGGRRPGILVMRDGAGKDSITLNGANNILHIYDKSGTDVLALDANAAGGGYAGLFLGGGSRPGILVMRDGAGKDSIELNGSSGDIVLNNADCAEDFDICQSELSQVEPGTVMVIDSVNTLRVSSKPYDKRVAGVVSGAGDCKPGLVLDKRQSNDRRKSISLMGKVNCKVDATYSSIEIGDLLTTSSTIGHAMRVNDPLKGFGAVIGKALQPLKAGQGIIAILVSLQ
jgi:hypothetical protein